MLWCNIDYVPVVVWIKQCTVYFKNKMNCCLWVDNATCIVIIPLQRVLDKNVLYFTVFSYFSFNVVYNNVSWISSIVIKGLVKLK